MSTHFVRTPLARALVSATLALALVGCGSDQGVEGGPELDSGTSVDGGVKSDGTIVKDGAGGSDGATADDTETGTDGGATTDVASDAGTQPDATPSDVVADVTEPDAAGTGDVTPGDAGDAGATDDAGTGQTDADQDGGGTDAGSGVATQCNPCGASKECATAADPDAACVNLGAAGSFCGDSCSADADCGAGYVCSEVTTTEAVKSKQCVLAKGECGCSDSAIAQGLTTPCYAEDSTGAVAGQCPGTRSCGPKGLSACTAEPPSKELCDGDDDDCDGQTDEDTCDDGNPCTKDACGGKNGCQNTPADGPCDDGDACTSDDACAAGSCGGKALQCDDSNPCTDDSCDKAKGCVNSDNSAACDDGDTCTTGDACKDGLCAPGGAKSCDDNNPCTTDTCNGKTGACDFVPLAGAGTATSCDDGDACTEKDACAEGKCAGQAVTCDDGDACTNDSCDKAKGCVQTPNSALCDDGDACTEKDACKAGKCEGAALTCDDGNACTDDSCDKDKGCVATPNNAVCDDGDKCTKDDACTAGKCEGASLTCDDGNVCTDDGCDKDKGCTTKPNAAPCDDNDKCTEKDYCAKGTCGGAAVTCDDGNACTDDSCDKDKGCVSAANTASCDDGDQCSQKDTCSDKTCKAGAKKSCDDSDACTLDTCEPKTGKCSHQAVSNCKACTVAKECDDGNPCTSETCAGGKCQGKQLADGAACDDGAFCTKGDACKAGTCTPGKTATCDDGNPCTFDVCDAQGAKCTHGPVAQGFQCGSKQLADDFKCVEDAVYKRASFAGCNGSVSAPKCSEDKADRHYKSFTKVADCKSPNICRIEDGKGFCGLPKLPNLQLTGFVLSQTTVLSGGNVKITWTVKNAGTVKSPVTRLAFYRSSDAVITTKDGYKGAIDIQGIEPGKTLTGSYTVLLGSKLAAGTYYVGAIVDSLGKVKEISEADNTISKKITVTAAGDIWVASNTKPQYTTLNWGGTYNYYRYVRNVGLKTVPKFNDKIWLSADPKVDKSDVQLLKLAHPSLAPDKYVAGWVKFTMPKTVKPGTWYIIYQADADGLVKEGNEANNFRVTKITYRGYVDLENTGVSAPTALGTGTPFTLVTSGKNIGNDGIGTTFYNRIYFSKDAVLGSGDIYVGIETRKGVKVGESWKSTRSVNIPTSVTTGTWYIIYVVDSGNRIKEPNEKNNVKAFKVQVTQMPNLRTYALKTYATSYFVKSTMSWYSYDRNYGTAVAGTYELRYYLSADATFDSKDLLLAKVKRGPLKYNQTQSTTGKWVIPATYKPGKYTLFAVTDATGLIKESNEKDNIRAYTVTIKGRPDLKGTLKPQSTTLTAGVKTSATLTWSNVGTTTAGKHYDRVYLNTKKAYGGYYLGQRTRDVLAAGKSASETFQLTPPSSLKSGTYWLVYRVDSSSQVAEMNEANNYHYTQVTLKALPDLYNYSLKSNTYSPYSGQTITASWLVRNGYYGTSGKTTVRFLLSKDTKVSKDDIKVGESDVAALAYGKLASGNFKFKVPATTVGKVFLLAYVDPDNKVKERVETNNVRYVTLSVKAVADIAVTAATVTPAKATAGAQVKVTATHKNLGNLGASFTASLWLVPASGSPIKLLEKLQPKLDPGKTATATETVVIPGQVAKGSYKLRWTVKASTAEAVTSNNTKDMAFTIE